MESVNHYHLFPIRWENSRLLKIKKNECSLSNLCSSSRNRFPTTYMELQLEALMRMKNNLLKLRWITTINTWFHITSEVLRVKFSYIRVVKNLITPDAKALQILFVAVMNKYSPKFSFFWYLPSHTQYWILILVAELD